MSKQLVAAVIVLLSAAAFGSAPNNEIISAMYSPFVRRVIMKSFPEASKCDDQDWPLDSGICQNLETAVGRVMLRRAREDARVK